METLPTAQPTPHRKTVSLRALLAVSFSLVSSLVVAAVIAALYIGFSQQIREDLRTRIKNVAAIAALQQNGDELVQISSESDPLYRKMREQNLKIVATEPDIAYVYTMRKDEQGIFFVVDVGGAGYEDTAIFGERYPDASQTLLNNFDILETAISDEEIYTDSFGSFLGGYAPIRNSQGEKVGVIGVDLKADAVLQKERQFLFISLGVFGLSFVVIIIAGWAIGNRLAQPISALAESVQRIASGDLAYRAELETTSKEIDQLAENFNKMAVAFKNLVESLERRIAERTEELRQRALQLESKSRESEKRVHQLRAIAEVARTISTIKNLSDLLPNIAAVISKEFGFYHIGIFLVDDTREYAVLAASNSEGGQRMLKRGHKLKIGEIGLVGFAAATGQARIALDTGADAVYFDNPDLPNTRSEIALPLRVGSEVIGILDVQSEQTEAFSEEDIELLIIMADQVSIAIQNARQFEAAQRATEEAQELYRRYILGEWRSLIRERERQGYRYSKAGVGPLKARVQSLEVKQVEKTGKTNASQQETGKPMVVPIKLRDEVLGVLNISSENSRIWEEDEVNMVESIAERVALAIDNVRLLETSRAQAAREKTISEITARIGNSVNLQNVLQSAVEELGRILPGAEVAIQLGAKSEKPQG
ncbi:MAG: GAF domain-containing protein [Anaerolineales bacterium]|nr:GAF domain-containing protein [Anaerolineales bacterium]MDW8278847.1 GAF domain-containing protein [Anaerolineales bacterium]